MKKKQIIDVIRKEDAVLFLERERKFCTGTFLLTILSIFIMGVITSTFFGILILSDDLPIELKLFSLFLGLTGFLFLSYLVWSVVAFFSDFFYTINTWRVDYNCDDIDEEIPRG